MLALVEDFTYLAERKLSEDPERKHFFIGLAYGVENSVQETCNFLISDELSEVCSVSYMILRYIITCQVLFLSAM